MFRLSLLLLVCPALALSRQQPLSFRSQAITKDALPKLQPRHAPKPTSFGRSSVTQLRAGSIVPLATTTATVTSAFLGINGAMLLTKPNFVLEKIYGIKPDEDKDSRALATWMMGSIGAIELGVAIQVYASIIAKGVEPLAAMGLGLIPRAVFFVYTILSGQMKSLQIQSRFFTINATLTCWVIASLLLGLGNPATTSKVYSSMCLLKSLIFLLAPNKASTKLFGKTCEGKPLALLRGAANELLTSSILLISVAWGSNMVTPVTAAGIVSLVWVILLGDMAWIDKTWRLMGSQNAQAQYVNMAISALFGAGFLLAK